MFPFVNAPPLNLVTLPSAVPSKANTLMPLYWSVPVSGSITPFTATVANCFS